MITNYFSHIGIGDTGEGVIRDLIVSKFINKSLPGFKKISDTAHAKILTAELEGGGQPFTFVRNPYNWYISRWLHALRLRRYKGSFRNHLLKYQQYGGHHRFTFWETYLDFTEDKITMERIGRFENFADDFVRIFSDLVSDFYTKEEIRNLFPEAFRQWRNNSWIEDIEVSIAPELYNPDMILHVQKVDLELFNKFGYDINALQ